MLFNKKIDLILIKFPIMFPLIYLFILYSFENAEPYLIIFTILILAEPHFGATWTIFFDKCNYPHFSEKKNIFIIGSLLIVFFCLLGFFMFKNLFLLIFFGYNIYHVTRQSIGICKLYNNDKREADFQLNMIYLFNIIFFFIGFFRFYLPIISEEKQIILVSFILGISLVVVFLYQFFKYRSLDRCLTTLTGMIIFYPICFVEKPVHAILLGVTMHYSQYIVITAKVYFGRNNNMNFFSKKNFSKIFKSNFFYIILLYGVLMTMFSLSGKSNYEYLKNLILVPIIGQMLHFYLDGFMWRFSETHNREVTLKHLKEQI